MTDNDKRPAERPADPYPWITKSVRLFLTFAVLYVVACLGILHPTPLAHVLCGMILLCWLMLDATR